MSDMACAEEPLPYRRLGCERKSLAKTLTEITGLAGVLEAKTGDGQLPSEVVRDKRCD